jgi:hypothetical protein
MNTVFNITSPAVAMRFFELGRESPKVVWDDVKETLKQSDRPYADMAQTTGKTWAELLDFEKQKLSEACGRYLTVDKRTKLAKTMHAYIGRRGSRAIFFEVYLLEVAERSTTDEDPN